MIGLVIGEILMSGLITGKFHTVELNENFVGYES